MANVCDCDVGVVRLRASDHRPGFGWVWLESIAHLAVKWFFEPIWSCSL